MKHYKVWDLLARDSTGHLLDALGRRRGEGLSAERLSSLLADRGVELSASTIKLWRRDGRPLEDGTRLAVRGRG